MRQLDLGLVGLLHHDRHTGFQLCRPDRHGLAALCRDLLGVELSKQQQTADCGAENLKPEQLAYAASDVLYLHALWAKMDSLLEREDRRALAQACFDFLPARARLDLMGYEDPDIFAHRA